VVVVENMRLALKIELGQRQRPAFDVGGHLPNQCLEIAFVGNPHAAEVSVNFGAVGVVKNGRKGLARQAPPLAAQMRHDSGRNPALQPQSALKPDIGIKEAPLLAPTEGEPHGEAFHIQTANRPAHILGRDAFDEIGARAFVEIAHQLFNRPQRQARA
jgi:hypothetical protein